MSGDTTKAVAVCCDYLAFRPGIRTRLLAQVDDGMKAQDLEGTRTTAISYDRDEDGEKGPRITDTTGETAIRPDRARLLLGELDRAERTLILEANIVAGHPIVTMADLLCFLNPIAQTAPGRVRQSARVFDRAIAETYGRHKPDAGKAHDGLAGCGSCARLKEGEWFSDPNYNRGRPTDLAGQLPTKLPMCRTCVRFCERLAESKLPVRLPSLDDLRYFRTHGTWDPKAFRSTNARAA